MSEQRSPNELWQLAPWQRDLPQQLHTGEVFEGTVACLAYAIRRDARLNPQERWARDTELLNMRFRDFGVQIAQAARWWLGAGPVGVGPGTLIVPQSTRDQTALDLNPEACWRCDARQSSSDVGLCDPCHADLVGDTEGSG